MAPGAITATTGDMAASLTNEAAYHSNLRGCENSIVLEDHTEPNCALGGDPSGMAAGALRQKQDG